MGGDALLRSDVPQDLRRQQKAHGCADGCRGTSHSLSDNYLNSKAGNTAVSTLRSFPAQTRVTTCPETSYSISVVAPRSWNGQGVCHPSCPVGKCTGVQRWPVVVQSLLLWDVCVCVGFGANTWVGF